MGALREGFQSLELDASPVAFVRLVVLGSLLEHSELDLGKSNPLDLADLTDLPETA